MLQNNYVYLRVVRNIILVMLRFVVQRSRLRGRLVHHEKCSLVYDINTAAAAAAAVCAAHFIDPF